MCAALALRGYSYKPWSAVRQAYGNHNDSSQPVANVSFIHYNRDIPGGKPGERLRNKRPVQITEIVVTGVLEESPSRLSYERLVPPLLEAAKMVEEPNRAWRKGLPACQMCWNRAEYVRRYNTNICAPEFDVEYTQAMVPGAKPGVEAAVRRMR